MRKVSRCIEKEHVYVGMRMRMGTTMHPFISLFGLTAVGLIALGECGTKLLHAFGDAVVFTAEAFKIEKKS